MKKAKTETLMLVSSRASRRLSVEEIAQVLKPIELAPLRENPLVCVLTGNYNYARYLGEAIDSVLGQSYTNFEMIVCDDGSTDESCEVVEGYAQRDTRVRLVRKQNGGQASAWNAAYQECKGQIICFLDSDDRYLPEKIERVVQAFRSHPDSGFVGHQLFRVDAVGRRDSLIPSFADSPSGWYGPFVVRHGCSPNGLAFGSGLCLRREISDSMFPLPESFRICADAVVMALSPLMTPIVGMPDPLGEYRRHRGNSWLSAEVSSESLDRWGDVDSKLWKVRREYLGKLSPVLAEAFPSFDERPGASLDAYIRIRLEARGGALSAYRELLRGESFVTSRRVVRWFWRLSILLPRPVFRYALGPNRLRRLFWRAMEVRRRLFANQKSVGQAVE